MDNVRFGRNDNGNEDDYSFLSKESREVSIDKIELPLFELEHLIKQGVIGLNILTKPSSKSWSNTHSGKSRLIESTLMHLPLLPIYLVQLPSSSSPDPDFVVVDGRKRLKIFSEFFRDRFNLTSLMVLSEENGKLFSDLDPRDRRKIEDHKIQVYIIKSATPRLLQFDLIMRLHSDKQSMNVQEIRNMIYPKDTIRFIEELSHEYHFRSLFHRQSRSSSLYLQETVLRFFAFYVLGYEEYFGDLNLFLNLTLEHLNEVSYDSYTQLNELRTKFSDTMALLWELFEDDFPTIEKRQLSYMRRQELNLPLFELLSSSFARYDHHILYEKRSQIRDSLHHLLEADDQFRESCLTDAYSKKHVHERFNRWHTSLASCLAGGDQTK